MLDKARFLADHGRQAGVKIIWTIMVERSADLNNETFGRNFLEEHIGHLNPDFQSDHFILKRSYSAFSCTGLKKFLADEGITQQLYAGVRATDCLKHTLYNAIEMPGEVAVIWDAVGDPRKNYAQDFKKDFQESALRNISFMLSDDLISEFSGYAMFRSHTAAPLTCLQYSGDFNPL